MNIENMTITDWLIIIGLGIVGGILSFLVTSFINWLRKGAEPCKSCDNGNNYQTKSTPCYYSRKGKNNYHYSSMGIVDPENYDYISVRQYHERYEDTE